MKYIYIYILAPNDHSGLRDHVGVSPRKSWKFHSIGRHRKLKSGDTPVNATTLGASDLPQMVRQH